MTRKDARELVMQTIFQMEAQKDFNKDNFHDFIYKKPVGEQKKYIEVLLENLCEQLTTIDATIDDHSTKWKISRLPKMDLAIARLSVCELIYMKELVPSAVSINEAINLAKLYGTEESYKFLNGMLGKVLRDNE